jgi:hypothetical protein
LSGGGVHDFGSLNGGKFKIYNASTASLTFSIEAQLNTVVTVGCDDIGGITGHNHPIVEGVMTAIPVSQLN